MRTRILIGLFTVLMLGASCTTAQNEIVRQTNYKSVDNGWNLHLSEDTTKQFRLELTGIEDGGLIMWVRLYDVERTTSNQATRDRHQIFNTYLVDSQYVYRGTACKNKMNYKSALIITALPLEQIIKRNLAIRKNSVFNTIYIETSEAYKAPTNEKWGAYTYLNL